MAQGKQGATPGDQPASKTVSEVADPTPEPTVAEPKPTPNLTEPTSRPPLAEPAPNLAEAVRPRFPEPMPRAGRGPGLATPSGPAARPTGRPAARLTGGAPPPNPSIDAPRADASGGDALGAGLLSGRGDPSGAGPPHAEMPAAPTTGNPDGAAGTDPMQDDPDLVDGPDAGGSGGGETGAGDVPEVELSESEVAGVLSGRVIPIGAFFGGTQSAPAGPASDETAPAPGATFLADAGRIAANWAEERHLGLTSAAGICVALSACAAAWFSAGTRVDIIRGVAALWVGYLVLRAGQWLAVESGTAEAGQHEPGLRRVGPVGWLAALGGVVAECGIYAGLAVGAVAERWGSVWTLAVAVLGLVAVRNLMTACSTPPGLGEQSGGAFRRLVAAVLTMPVGGRILLIGIVAPFWGARVALVALLDWAIVSIGFGIARPSRSRRDCPGGPK